MVRPGLHLLRQGHTKTRTGAHNYGHTALFIKQIEHNIEAYATAALAHIIVALACWTVALAPKTIGCKRC